MPNVTITVPEELKNEMDKYLEVSWSEICRNAISQYISQRKNPIPQIEMDLRNLYLSDYDFETGYPTLNADFKISNRMNSELKIDRILASVMAYDVSGRTVGFGQTFDLNRKTIGPLSVGAATLRLALTKEKLTELRFRFTATFYCIITLTIFADGFSDALKLNVSGQIAIDVWHGLTSRVLGEANQATH